MTKVAIVNCYGDGNRGSAALNEAAIAIARQIYPDTEIGLVCINEFSGPERHAAFRHTLAAESGVRLLGPLVERSSLLLGRYSSLPVELAVSRLPDSLINADTAAFLEQSNLVISRGGVVYHASKGTSAQFLRRTSAMRYAQARGVPSMHIGLHAMDVETVLAKKLIARDFRKSTLLLPRGPISAEWVRRLAPGSRFHRSPDSVVSLRAHGSGPVVTPDMEHWGISLTHRVDQAINPVIDLIAKGAREGRVKKVSIVNQVTGPDSDIRTSRMLAEHLSSLVEVRDVGDDLSPASLMRYYSGLGVLIASRLHAGIFGLLGGTPSIVIENKKRSKYFDVYSELGLESLVVSRDDYAAWWPVLATCLQEGMRARIRNAVDQAVERHEESLDLARSLVPN